MENMGANYKPGQILYIRSSMGPWYYISVLRCVTPVKHMDETYGIYTCCDLSIDGDGSECLTLTRSNTSLLNVDTSFEEIREATRDEREYLYKVLVKAFKDYDLGWDKHFTDSTYDDIRDWLCWEVNADLDNTDNDNPLLDTIYEITNYIWDTLCKETGNYQACTDYVEPEMVNKQEFIAKVKRWLELETDWDQKWDEQGLNPDYGKIDELVKYLEE